MGAFSDGLLGFALGAGQTISDEYENINEEKRLIRKEERTTKRAIAAEGRAEGRSIEAETRAEGRLVEKEGRADKEFDRRQQVTDDFAEIAATRRLKNEKLKLEYAQKLGITNVKDLNSLELSQIQEGTDPGLARRGEEVKQDIGQESIEAGIGITADVATHKGKAEVDIESEKKRKELGLPPLRGRDTATILPNKSLTPTQVRDVIQDAAVTELGETGEQYNAERKKEDIPTLAKDIKSGGESGRDVVASILNGGEGEGNNLGRNTIEDLHKELSHITIAGLSTEVRDAALNKKAQINSAQIEGAVPKAVTMAKEIETKMIQAWSQVDNAGFIDRFATRTGVSHADAVKQYMDANQESLRNIMGLSEEDASNSIAYKRIWNIYKRPLNDLISGKMEGGMINDDG